MNEIQVIQQQLRLERAHFAAALRACEAVLDRQAWISGGELAAAMSDYFAIALRRFGADASPPGATAESGRWREFLRLFEFESQRFFQALDQLRGVPVTRWRATSRMDADSIVSERLAYLRLQAVLPPVTGTAEPGDGLHAIVLAAGESSRFGSAKQLVRVAGRPLLHSAVTRAAGVAGSAVTIVLGSRAAEFSPLLNHTPANIVINRDWREGMASSIRAGISRLPASCTAVLLMTVDQAALTSADLMRLVTSWRAQFDRIVAAHYGTVTGIPAIFPRAYFFELSSLRGDVGARSILQRNRDQVTRVPMTRAAIDIDTPEDLLKLSADP